jgi:hypothetical protein
VLARSGTVSSTAAVPAVTAGEGEDVIAAKRCAGV